MKVYYQYPITATRGKDKHDPEHVYYQRNGGILGFKREFVMPHLTSNHELMGLKMKAAANLYKSVGPLFKEDLDRYARLYNSKFRGPKMLPLSGYNIFISAVMKYSLPIPTIATLVTTFGGTLEDWIAGGYLRVVPNITPFTATVQ